MVSTNNLENNHGDREVHPWLVAESHGDPTLLRLLVVQDELYAMVAEQGGSSAPEELLGAGMWVAEQIVARQVELGIDPLSDSPEQT